MITRMNTRKMSIALEAAGFKTRGRATTWTRGRALQLAHRGSWLELKRVRAHSRGGEAACGLWKNVNGHELCDLPPCVIGEGPLEAALDWALASLDGSLPADWKAPTAAELASWVSPAALVVRSGTFLARGAVERSAERLALVFELGAPPAAGVVDQPPSAARRRWIEATLADAQERWRLVCFRLAPNASSARAEIDLSGVPPQISEQLVRASLSALAWVVAWMLPTLSFLFDPNAESRALESSSPAFST